eukprot:TRINITY_DN5782_c0_g1_i2.p1 TRINITY_DN5782_c0_g1~~TRINITY_DN5782_c0_g1_i2.p1  ORF type:complete len:549 (-),score=98.29 TRINITY_DN5782_c0_g1_i2:433-2079(-)
MKNVFNFFRRQVSADKNRFQFVRRNGSIIEIDMTYITDRIIAMSFPAEGVESAYRNDIDDCSVVLNNIHPGKYRVYNLSQRTYDYSKFNEVVDWCGWPDHHSPPMVILSAIMEDIHRYLQEDPEHVIIVHCLAGKGRTGTVISCYLLFSGLFDDPAHARNYFARKRSHNNWGVSGPSQIRTVNWFWDILNRKCIPREKTLNMTEIIINKVPDFSISPRRNGFCPVISIYDFNNLNAEMTLIWSNNSLKPLAYEKGDEPVHIRIPEGCIVTGDVLILFEHVSMFSKEVVCRFSFSIDMVIDNNLSFRRLEIDDAVNNKSFPVDFNVTFCFSDDAGLEPLVPVAEQVETHLRDHLTYLFEEPRDTGGKICFLEREFIDEIIEQERNNTISSGEKGGYLAKLGTKGWKRRWFVLHPERIEYFTKPNTTNPLEVIFLKDVRDISENSEPPNSFSVSSNWTTFTCYADSEYEKDEWLESIQEATYQCKQYHLSNIIGSLYIQFISASHLVQQGIMKINSYGVALIGGHKLKTQRVKGQNPVYNTDVFQMFLLI